MIVFHSRGLQRLRREIYSCKGDLKCRLFILFSGTRWKVSRHIYIGMMSRNSPLLRRTITNWGCGSIFSAKPFQHQVLCDLGCWLGRETAVKDSRQLDLEDSCKVVVFVDRGRSSVFYPQESFYPFTLYLSVSSEKNHLYEILKVSVPLLRCKAATRPTCLF